MELNQDEVLRYSRHLMIPDVGMEGQRKLKNASVLVVGTGGLGSPVALYLAAAGIGHLGLVDYDCVDDSNLQRQVIHSTETVGQLKVESARKRLQALNPYIQVDIYNEVFTSENARRISEGYDVLVDGTDNFPTRYLLNDLAVLTGRPYVYGSIFRFEGQATVFDARVGPCYRCLFPEPPPVGLIPSCSEGGVFGVLPGTIGTIQATEVIKLVMGIGETLVGKLMLYDALDMSFQAVSLRKNPRCKICGPEPEVRELVDYEQFCGVPTRTPTSTYVGEPWNITPLELMERTKNGAPVTLVDVRNPIEQQISRLPDAISAPWERVTEVLDTVDRDAELVMFCRTGERSARAVRKLLLAGFRNVKNLSGGINAYAEQVDPSMLRY